MNPRPTRRIAILCVLGSAACASVDPGPDYDLAETQIRAATGVERIHHPESPVEATNERRAELLADGLELTEAVEFGLLNNPRLQASFHEIGMAKADRVQAGLLSNPSLGALFRFPFSGGSTEFEAGLFTNLADLWQLSDRERVAENALQQRVLSVAQEAANLAAEIRVSFADALAARELVAIARENHDTAGRLRELSAARLDAAAGTAIDANLAQLELLDTELALQDAELAATDSRRALAELLGLAPRDPLLSLVQDAASDAGALPPIEELEQLALERRLDVRAARASVEQAAAELDRQRSYVFKRVDIGVVAEKGDGWTLGPGIDMELPIFDQNQAQIARAHETLERERLRLSATRLCALREVDSAHAREHQSRAALRIYHDDLLARAEETLEQARESYRLGRTTILEALDAQRQLLDARGAYIQRKLDASRALSDLERATGTPREQLFQPSANHEKGTP